MMDESEYLLKRPIGFFKGGSLPYVGEWVKGVESKLSMFCCQEREIMTLS